MARMFGTDGVRGLANASLGPELALRVAAAAAAVLGPDGGIAVVGRDPRISGQMLEAAVTAGLTAGGLDVLPVGVLPTPAVAYLTGAHSAALGVMISASHNPMPDNGIKIFAAGGHKLDDEVEDRIEALVHGGELHRPVGAGLGRVLAVPDVRDQYVAHIVSATERLSGVKVVVDCANGAASVVAPQVYRAAGAEVIAIHADPTGLNINDGCGSTHLGDLRHAAA